MLIGNQYLHSLNMLLDGGREKKVNLGQSILLIYFYLAKMVGWVRVCHTVPFCLALDDPKVESTKSSLKDLWHLTRCYDFRHWKEITFIFFHPS